ncbi:MAG TPA: sensor histidine kinase [Polyangiaceae bacterium]
MVQRDDSATWRASVLDAMLRALAVAGPGIVVLSLLFREPPRFDPPFFLVAAAVLTVIGLRFAHTLSFHLRAGLSIALILFACLTWIALTGFSIGGAAGAVGGIVIAVLLLGKRTGFVLLAATGLALIAFGAAISSGWSEPRFTDSDPHIFANWVRMGVSFCLLTGAVAFGVDYVVRHIESKYVELNGAYVELGELHRKLETAKEEERRFIARELHDDLGQALTVLKLSLKSGKTTPFSDPVRVVDGLIVKVRELSRSLRPALLDEVGLGPALSAYIEEQSTVSGIPMDLDQKRFAGRLPSDLEITCFRIVQEAVTNALRHAEPKRVTIRVARDETSVKLQVSDDGKGFAGIEAIVRAAVEGHLGIVGMRERVRTLGGVFLIRAQPGEGTAIDVEIPIRIDRAA